MPCARATPSISKRCTKGASLPFLLVLLAVLIFAYGVYSLDMSYARIIGGLGELGSMVC